MKKITTCLFLLLISLFANAQKLPNVQTTSLRAPADIKIDGKATEWNNQFQAYNKAVEVFYTLSNDNENLYLTIRAADALVIRKIINGSLTFTLNTADKKNDKEHNISFTYPVFDKQNWPILNLRQIPSVTKDSTISSKQIDSFMNAENQQMLTKAKEIKVFGIPSISDTLISVYNEYQIKAAALFDHHIAYTFELAVPLKYLGLSTDNPEKFTYNVQLNGKNTIEGVIFTDNYDGQGNTKMQITVKNPPHGIELEFMRHPTDFWGEYTLAR